MSNIKLVIAGMSLLLAVGHAIECYECNIYEDAKDTFCDKRTCPDGYNVCTTITYKPLISTELDDMDCYYNLDNGTSYRGFWDTTSFNQPCLKWTTDANFTFNDKNAANYGLGDHNYCRNPDLDIRPWCYTTLDADYAYCGVPSCFDHIINVETRRCGWINKSFCQEGTLGDECYESCDSDLCNKPPGYNYTITVNARGFVEPPEIYLKSTLSKDAQKKIREAEGDGDGDGSLKEAISLKLLLATVIYSIFSVLL